MSSEGEEAQTGLTNVPHQDSGYQMALRPCHPTPLPQLPVFCLLFCKWQLSVRASPWLVWNAGGLIEPQLKRRAHLPAS